MSQQAYSPVSMQPAVLGVTMIAAPVLLLASTIAFAAGGGLNRDAAGGAILVYAMVAFAVVAVVLAHRIARVFPRTGVALLVAGVAGSVAGAGFGVDSVHAALPGGGALQDIGGTAGLLAIFPAGAVFPLAWLGIAIALYLAEPATRRPAALLGLGAVLFPVSRVADVEVLAIGADLVFAAALVPLGMATFRGRSVR
jgi:hypothetical protein